MLSPSSGLANKLIIGVGGQPIHFLTDPFWFREVLVALASVSPSLYEAAAVDGVSRLQRVWHISLPAYAHVAWSIHARRSNAEPVADR